MGYSGGVSKNYTFANYDQAKSFYFMTFNKLEYHPNNSNGQSGFYVDLFNSNATIKVNIHSQINPLRY